MTAPEPRRGEIWYADVPGEKRRPVLVLTRNPMGRHLSSVICAPITSRIRGLSTEVLFDDANGLAHESAANFDNLFLLPRSRLLHRLGEATAAQLAAACRAANIAVGCG